MRVYRRTARLVACRLSDGRDVSEYLVSAVQSRFNTRVRVLVGPRSAFFGSAVELEGTKPLGLGSSHLGSAHTPYYKYNGQWQGAHTTLRTVLDTCNAVSGASCFSHARGVAERVPFTNSCVSGQSTEMPKAASLLT